MTKDKQHAALCRMTLNALLALGYKPYYFDSDQTQIDCIIEGVCFAVYHAPFTDSVGYGCVFEPNNEVDAAAMTRFAEALQKEGSPFHHLLYEEESGTIHLESEVAIEALTPQLLQQIVAAINKKNGTVEQIRSISYQWEER